jgi:hypothetical protein
VARLLGNHCQQQQFQIAWGENPWPAPAAFAAGAFLKAVLTRAMFAVMGMMLSHLFSSVH